MIIEIPWTDDIDDKLKVSGGKDLQIVKREVLQGISQLWKCFDNEHLAYVVTRIEKIDNSYELCLVLGEGSGFYKFAPKFVEFAKRQNISFRTHVKRKGLIKMWSRFGIEPSEYILRG